ncbi:hypothetical protein DAEQUDRAFT_758194 [Daedalea quercina L-15889]|uniref:DUF6534 domain-containing protein n=1 Tax=Daedalea quercina L-15889 TaxID=1314783 RepID=A0A165NSK2_9APHY|nr:hypothetical protein DAEQUDRAFT_758194 [Daedalea quercina L-15889]
MPALQIGLGPTLGCLFFGTVIFSSMLYGFACAQFIHYSRHYLSKDKSITKVLVVFLWQVRLLLDTTMTTSDMSIGWFYFVQRHGDVSGPLVLPKQYELEYAATAVTTCLVQMFYVHEIWQLVRAMPRKIQWIIVLFPMLLSLLSLAFALVGVHVTASHNWIISKTLPPNIGWTTSRVWTAAVADIYITVVLSWALKKKKTGFKNSDRMINRLITYTVNRGVLLSVVQITLCGTYLGSIKQNTMVWAIFHIAGGKIYVNSMLAVLNARQRVKEGNSEVYNMSDITDDSATGSRTRRNIAADTAVYYIQ